MNSKRCSQCKHFIIANAGEGKIYGCDRSKCVFEPTTKNDLGVDCISRAEVIEEINSVANDAWDEEQMRVDLIAEINALPSVTPQEPRWIPVRERLPEDYETVIASVDRGYVYPEARYSKEDGWEWAYESGADYWTEIECDVVAWMPLPKPYEPQESEEKDGNDD